MQAFAGERTRLHCKPQGYSTILFCNGNISQKALTRVMPRQTVGKRNGVHKQRRTAPAALVVLTLNGLRRKASGGQEASPRAPQRLGP